MMNVSRNGYPFTASQWQELEHQVLIFKYMVSGIPVPPDLLYSVSRSLESSLSSKLLLHQPHHIGWNCLQMGFGRKIDPEPGRCRRTDGKKWRCSKEAYPDSKYCERHMHRGRNRSRKPVEVFTTPSSSITSQSTSTGTPTGIPFSSITKNTSPSPSSPTSLSFSSLTSLGSESHPQSHSLHHPFNHYYQCSGESPKSHFSSQDHITTAPSFMLESDAYSYVQRAKVKVEELPFFSETSGTMRSRMSEASLHDSWQLGSPGSNVKQSSYAAEHSYSSRSLKHDYNGMDYDIKNHIPLQFMERECENKKVMHHFFDELPLKERNLWHENDDKFSNHAPSSNVQLSLNSHLLP